jgi:hypothetical protein
VGEISDYNLRNRNHIAAPAGTKQGYVNSFFPSAIHQWNQTDDLIKRSPSIDSFKYNIKKSKCLTKNKLYSKFSGASAIKHTRLRLGLSGLKAHRHSYKHIAQPNCDLCGARREDSLHYLLQCNIFAAPRLIMLRDICNLYLQKGTC